ncbi:hypothetical protein MUK70_01015 [Dyadobacter chenwenxiniae]|nr:hypothetical protein [Dyadobacter chenwenxiniae]UON83584.1 hypothetical protein MUK70_01015 [Dyadobacter chenwenxiniae]
MHISGSNKSEEIAVSDSDHIFSLIATTGGWATWKRAWKKYDFWMEHLSEMKSQKHLQRLVRDKDIWKYWYERFDQVFEGDKKHNWEVQWQYTLFKNYGLVVVPNSNLVDDIGHLSQDLSNRSSKAGFDFMDSLNSQVVQSQFAANKTLMSDPVQINKPASIGAHILDKLAGILKLN